MLLGVARGPGDKGLGTMLKGADEGLIGRELTCDPYPRGPPAGLAGRPTGGGPIKRPLFAGDIGRPFGANLGGPRGSLGPGCLDPSFIGRGLTGLCERHVRGATPC